MPYPPYVETDGDWSIRTPGMLEDVVMHIFLVDADREQLRAVSRALFETPTNGAVRADPIFPGFVMLVFAEVGRGYSEAQPELGDQAEIDMSVFVPVTVEAHGEGRGLAAFVPYIFVDNVAGMVTGREVVGFPKHVGRFHIAKDHSSFEVHSPVLPVAGAHKPVEERLVARLTSKHHKSVESMLESPEAAVLEMVTAASEALQHELPRFLFGNVPLLFLKQFRDAVDPRLACHQEVIEAVTKISFPSKIRTHSGHYMLDLPAYAKPRITATLGIAAKPKVFPVSFELHLNFRLPTGTSLWKAP